MPTTIWPTPEMVRRALGYDQLSLRGTSYGTQVALLAAEMFPDAVRSAVLSSPIDPRANWMEGVPAGFAQALDRLATGCAENDACTDQVGDLRGAIEETVERLDEQPEQVTVQPPGGESTTLTHTPSRFLAGLFNLFYEAPLTELLPAVVDRAHDGDLTPLANIVTQLDEQLEAAERWDGTVDGAHPSTISLDAEVPTLVVTGEFDHVTPPQLGQQVHDALAVSHLIEVPQADHSPLETLTWPACGQSIVTDFLDDPATAPDADCAADFSLLQLGIPVPTRFGRGSRSSARRTMSRRPASPPSWRDLCAGWERAPDYDVVGEGGLEPPCP